MAINKPGKNIFNTTSIDIELAIADHFCYRRNLIVPNVWWGLGLNHEADLLIVKPSGYATEIEIKVSKQDLKADSKKSHEHKSKIIKYLYFAVPEKLVETAVEVIPETAGLFKVESWGKVTCIRTAKKTEALPLSEKNIKKLYELAAMRIWSLKQKLNRLSRQEMNRLEVTNETI